MAEQGGFRDIFYTARDGLKLHVRLYGRRGPHLPVMCLPGLTRNARDFDALARILANDAKRPRLVATFDYRGRGLSDKAADWRDYTVPAEADDVADGMAVLGIEHAAFIGTSRGGLITMALAAMRPTLLKAVVLNDIGPVMDGEGLARIRSYLERAPRPRSMDEAIALQKAVHGEAFPVLGEEDWRRYTEAFYREEKGRLAGAFDRRLVKLLQAIDLASPQPELWPQFAALSAFPLMAVRGANSRLLSADTLLLMGKKHPQMEAITVAGQGHAPLLETGTLPQRISAFLARAESGG